MEKRDATLDTLRAVAALLVLLIHLPPVAAGRPIVVPWWAAGASSLLRDLGVPIFFALSGYLLTLLMPAYSRHRFPVASFYIKRIARIAPLFYVAIVLWMLRLIWIGLPIWPPRDIAMSASLLFNLFPRYADSIVFAGWTIGVEILFYLLFPILIFYLRNGLTCAIAVLAALAFAQLFNSVLPAVLAEPELANRYRLLNLFWHLPNFLIGVFVARVLAKCKELPEARLWGLLAVAGAALILVGATADRADFLIGERHWQVVAASLILAGLVLCPPTFGATVMSFLGRISYSIYLLHGLIIRMISEAYVAIYASIQSTSLAYIACVALTLACVVPASWLTYRLVELPGIALGNKVIRRLDRKASLAAA